MDKISTDIELHDSYMTCTDAETAFSYASLALVEYSYPMYWPNYDNCIYESWLSPIQNGNGGIDLSWFTNVNYVGQDRLNNKSLQKSGWKFHISLANSDENISTGWNIVKKYLIMNCVFTFKVIRNKFRSQFSSNEEQSGKTITIYSYLENRDVHEWEMIFKQITIEFINQNIKPGKFPTSDYEIKQSSYFSYRNDKKGFIYNTSNDPYKSIVIDIPNQPKRSAAIEFDEKSDSDDDQAAVQLTEFDEKSILANISNLTNPSNNGSTENLSIEEKIEVKEKLTSSHKNSFWIQKPRDPAQPDSDFCCFKSCVIL